MSDKGVNVPGFYKQRSGLVSHRLENISYKCTFRKDMKHNDTN